MKTLKEFLEKYQIDHSVSLDLHNFGSVYKGVDENQNAWAVKCSETHPDFDNGLFVNRYAIAKSLNHPNLLNYADTYCFKEVMITNVALMPLLEMGSLNNLTDLKHFDKVLIVNQILDALFYLHNNNIVWQNLSCKHVLLIKEFGNLVPKIINYGNQDKIPIPFFADYEYLAPEQFDENSEIDPRSDIWSFSVLIYKIWTGRLPFGEKSASLPNAKIKERILADWEPGLFHLVPEPYKTIAEKGLIRKKEDRWCNCGEIIAVIKNWESNPENTIEPPIHTEGVNPSRKILRKPSKPISWWFVALLFFFAAFLGYWLNHL